MLVLRNVDAEKVLKNPLDPANRTLVIEQKETALEVLLLPLPCYLDVDNYPTPTLVLMADRWTTYQLDDPRIKALYRIEKA